MKPIVSFSDTPPPEGLGPKQETAKTVTATRQALNPSAQEADQAHKSLRPKSFSQFIGQTQTCKNLDTFIKAAQARKKPLDHVLLSGPPGLGKTSLAGIIAAEMGGQFRLTSGASINRVGELAAILTNLAPFDVLCIDEIHRLPKAIEEILYPPLEDGKLDLVVGDGPAARTVRLTLSPFTLVAATTRQGLLSRPLRDRFGIHAEVAFYKPSELAEIILQAADAEHTPLSHDMALFLGERSRGTPRIALRLLRRLIDFAMVEGTQQKNGNLKTQKSLNQLGITFAQQALHRLGIDKAGLDTLDRRYLQALSKQFNGGPVGIDTLAAALFEEKQTLEDVVEPFLIQQGFIKRTPQGRVLEKGVLKDLCLENVG